MSCDYGEKLIAYLYGEAGEAVRGEVEAHLPGCASCRAELAALRSVGDYLGSEAGGPSPWVTAAIIREARAAAAPRRGFSFRWGEALLSGALASMLAFVFAVSDRQPAQELAWNGFDSKLDSLEYSVYQAQSDMNSVSSDWDYGISALEDESLNFGNNV